MTTDNQPRGPVVRIRRGAKLRRRRTAPVHRYTRFVIFGRNFLWALIACMIGVVLWISASNNGDGGSRLVFSGVTQNENMENVMLHPRYQGLDERGQPFTVIADQAVQKDKQIVDLTAIRADMIQKEGTWLALNAGQGELNLDTKHMSLDGGVNMFYEGGYEFRSDHAQVDIGQGTAYGDSPVEGQGPPGTLKANSFKVEQRGKVIRFNGSVRMTIYPK